MHGLTSGIHNFNQRMAQARKRWQQMEEALDEECGRKQEYTVAEAAVFWDIHEKTVRRWIGEGKVRWTNHGVRKTRISRQEMLAAQWEREGEKEIFAKVFSMYSEGR